MLFYEAAAYVIPAMISTLLLCLSVRVTCEWIPLEYGEQMDLYPRNSSSKRGGDPDLGFPAPDDHVFSMKPTEP